MFGVVNSVFVVVVAAVRDISASMWGMHSKWTSSVILRLIELTRRQSMRLGYIEFNEHSWKYRAATDKGGHFFVKDYEKVAMLNCCSSCCLLSSSLLMMTILSLLLDD